MVAQGEGRACEFSYTAVGGTNEDWVMVVQLLTDGRLLCTVER